MYTYLFDIYIYIYISQVLLLILFDVISYRIIACCRSRYRPADMARLLRGVPLHQPRARGLRVGTSVGPAVAGSTSRTPASTEQKHSSCSDSKIYTTFRDLLLSKATCSGQYNIVYR